MLKKERRKKCQHTNKRKDKEREERKREREEREERRERKRERRIKPALLTINNAETTITEFIVT